MPFGWGRNKRGAEHRDDAAPRHAGTAGANTSDDAPAVSATDAIDLAADLLRSYGELAFDVETDPANEIGERFETWARHLLVGVAAPHRRRADGDPEEAVTASVANEPADPDATDGHAATRDLSGLRLDFRQQRKRERRYVVQALGQFREAAWAFVSGLRRSLAKEQAADRRLGHRLRRLEGAVQSGEPARIRQEAQETVALLTEFLSERGAHQRAEVRELAARLESLRDELDTVRAQASLDGLTEIYNRAAFDEQIEREIDLATLFGQTPCLILIDIDHFKWINDHHGHPCGDAVLKRFADTLSRCFMRRDDFLARYGGEEFAVILRDIGIRMTEELAQRAMNTIRNLEVEFPSAEEPIRLTASMGIARLRLGEAAGSWVERADRALYRAKDAGRDRIELDPIDVEDDAPPPQEPDGGGAGPSLASNEPAS